MVAFIITFAVVFVTATTLEQLAVVIKLVTAYVQDKQVNMMAVKATKVMMANVAKSVKALLLQSLVFTLRLWGMQASLLARLTLAVSLLTLSPLHRLIHRLVKSVEC